MSNICNEAIAHSLEYEAIVAQVNFEDGTQDLQHPVNHAHDEGLALQIYLQEIANTLEEAIQNGMSQEHVDKTKCLVLSTVTMTVFPFLQNLQTTMADPHATLQKLKYQVLEQMLNRIQTTTAEHLESANGMFGSLRTALADVNRIIVRRRGNKADDLSWVAVFTPVMMPLIHEVVRDATEEATLIPFQSNWVFARKERDEAVVRLQAASDKLSEAHVRAQGWREAVEAFKVNVLRPAYDAYMEKDCEIMTRAFFIYKQQYGLHDAPPPLPTPTAADATATSPAAATTSSPTPAASTSPDQAATTSPTQAATPSPAGDTVTSPSDESTAVATTDTGAGGDIDVSDIDIFDDGFFDEFLNSDYLSS